MTAPRSLAERMVDAACKAFNDSWYDASASARYRAGRAALVEWIEALEDVAHMGASASAFEKLPAARARCEAWLRGE